MRVTFVIPCYNEDPAYLLRAVRSTEGPNCETIVVDDGSTHPETIACLDQLLVKMIRTSNGGPARAINVGIHAASGQYVITLGSDDHVSPGYAGHLADHLDATPSTIIAYPSWQEFGSSHALHTPPLSVNAGEMIISCPIIAGSMFRRMDWEGAGGLEENLRHGFEDWEWWVRLLLQCGGIARLVEGPTYHYHIRERSRNAINYMGVDALRLTREAMVANNPGHNEAMVRGLLADLEVVYALGQNQSPIAAAATAQARYWARRYGKLEGARQKLHKFFSETPARIRLRAHSD